MAIIPNFDVETMKLNEIKEVVKVLLRLANLDSDLITHLQGRVLQLELIALNLNKEGN